MYRCDHASSNDSQDRSPAISSGNSAAIESRSACAGTSATRSAIGGPASTMPRSRRIQRVWRLLQDLFVQVP
jgi:hypothetical protein